jgi:hypothetical protein
LNVDGGVIDSREIADRQGAVRDDSEQRDGSHQEAGCNWPSNENF